MALIQAGRYLNKTNLYHITHFVKSYGLKSSIRKVKSYLTQNRAYSFWFSAHRLTESEAADQRSTEKAFSVRPKFSILVPTYNTDPVFLCQMIESVTGQTYTNWQLVIADGSPDHAAIHSIVESYHHPHIVFKALEENLGISGNTNAALALADGDYIALLDHDDILEPDALFEAVKAINEAVYEYQPPKHGVLTQDAESQPDSAQTNESQFTPDILYTDEDMIRSGEDAFFHNPAFKPDFNEDYLCSCNYITHLYIVKAEIARKVGGFSSDCDGSQDYDFILKTSEQAKCILHLPKVLYHWRVHMNSVAGNPENKMYAYDSAIKALNSHYQRLNLPAHAEKGLELGFYRAVYGVQGQPKVSIILQNCGSGIREALQNQVAYTNYEITNHASDATGDYLFFLSGIIEIKPADSKTDFLTLMLGNCQRNEIGLVGVKILSKKNRVAECGLYYTKEGDVYSPFKGFLANEPGYYGLAESQRYVSLIGPSCFMVSRKTLKDYRKESSQKPSVYDLCMYLNERGQHITVLPQIHAVSEKASGNDNRLPVFHFSTLPDYLKVHPQDPFYTPIFSEKRPYELDF